MKGSSTSSELAETLDSDSSSGLTVSIYQPIVGNKAKPTKRISSVGLRIGTNFIIFGGFNNQRNILGDLWVLPLDYSTSIERASEPVTNDDSTGEGNNIPPQNMTRSQYIQMLLQGSSYMEIMQNLQLFGMGLDDDDDVEDEGDYENDANEYYDEEVYEDDEDDDDDDEDDDADADADGDADDDDDDDDDDDNNANDDVAEDVEDASVDNDEAVDAEN